ncbi:unnamed protein product [Effrenium voratum]|uniref:Uncharacterized protein n=1 Tax=Effrenium voratum TaxID=2562239 RepID=A0AA36IKG4_9DINO|nr:unnamed protein product [Effrenium voratum]
MEECELRDGWSRVCIGLPPVLIQVLVGLLCSIVTMLVGLFAVYVYLSRRAKRPRARSLSFGLMTFGFLLGLPSFLWHAANPTLLPSTHVGLHATFVVGDVIDHVGFVMLIYWDIVNEGVRLALALDPKGRKLGLRMSTAMGVICIVVQIVFLVPFWILIYTVDTDWQRSTLCSAFAVMQYVIVFGAVPSFIFGTLAWRLRSLWKDLPGDIPLHLLYRLRYTQLCLTLLTLLGVTDGILGLTVALVPFFTVLSGFLYDCVALLSLSILTLVLLGIEVFLTYQKARHRTNRPCQLDASEVLGVVQSGVSLLKITSPAPSAPCAPPAPGMRPAGPGLSRTWSRLGPVMPPVWERGLGQGIAETFQEIYGGTLNSADCMEDPPTSEVCIHLVKPMTAPARCSMWECLAAGFTSNSHVCAGAPRRRHLARPTVMVSHCWASSYRELMLIMKRYDDNTDRSNYFFVDVFSMNQHDFADLGTYSESAEPPDMYDMMLDALTRSIKVPGCMLLAMVPHENSKMLTRSWCLYEIYIAWKVKAEVSCGFIPEAEQVMKQSLTKDDRFIRRMLSKINAEASSATVKADRDMILKLIHSAGVDRFNSFVREKLRTSLRVVALTTLREVEGKDMEIEDVSLRSPGSWGSPSSPGSAPDTPRSRSAFVHRDREDESDESSFSI